MPTTHYEFLRSLQDAVHEMQVIVDAAPLLTGYEFLHRIDDALHKQQVIVDEAIAAESRAEEAQTIREGRSLRSVTDLRDDYYEGRAEEHLMRDGA